MAKENDKIFARQASARQHADIVLASFSMLIANHFISAFVRMKIPSGETPPDRYIPMFLAPYPVHMALFRNILRQGMVVKNK